MRTAHDAEASAVLVPDGSQTRESVGVAGGSMVR